MADEDDDQKTEDPTQKKLSEARQQGNLPISRDLATWIMLLGIVCSVAYIVPLFAKNMMAPLAGLVTNAGSVNINSDNVAPLMAKVFTPFTWPMLAIIGFLLLLGLMGWIMQTGFFFSTELLKFRFDRLNPIEGFKKIFSSHALLDLVKAIGKIMIIGYVGYTMMKPAFFQSESLTGMDNLGMVAHTYDLSARILFAVFLVYSLIVLIDVVYQRFTYFKNLRMSKTDLKEEFRQTEGDPHVKNKLKQIRQAKARKRMMAAVPKADVVITNPTHYAVALKYDSATMQAPVLLAKGHDDVAMKIREVAQDNKIPIVSNPPLARALYAAVEIDEAIPPEQYRAVAEVISYVYKLKGGRKINRQN